MNEYGLTRVSAMVPGEVYRVFQACAARAGLAFPVWVRKVLFDAAQVDESALPPMSARSMRMTNARRVILEIFERAGDGFVTTLDVSDQSRFSRATVYNTVQDLVREGLIVRGENVRNGPNAGAPCKSYQLTGLGKAALEESRTSVERAHAEFQQRTQADHVDRLAPVRARADQEAYQVKLHSALRYVAMSRLGRAIDSEADLAWLTQEHARLTGIADLEVASGAATFEAHYRAVMARIEALGGFEAISERFNIG